MCMDALLILLLFQTKHWWIDFWIQSYQQTVCKGIYGNPVGISHTLEHVIGTLITLLILCLFIPISITTILVVSLCDCILHYHIDWIKMRYGVKNIQTSRFWREFGLDQYAHQLTYLFFAYYIISR